MVRVRSARLLRLAALLLVAGCERGPVSAGRTCLAPAPSLPGAAPFPPALGAAVAAAGVPAEALLAHRRVCNRLALEPGAFARRHALDAIDWRPWSAAALAEAAAEGRPVLALTGDKGECGRLLKQHGVTRAPLEQAINAVRGGESVGSQ